MGAGVLPEFFEHLWLHKHVNAESDLAETLERDAQAVLNQPLGVVTLLRHRRSVAFGNYRQMELQGFADASGAGLPDEEIGERHVIVNLRGEALDEDALLQWQGAQLVGELDIVAA